MSATSVAHGSVRRQVLVGDGLPNVASRIGTVPRKANRSNTPPFGRCGFPMKKYVVRSFTAGSSWACSVLNMLVTVAPCEYPKITMGSVEFVVLYAPVTAI